MRENTIQTVVSEEEFQKLVRPLVGLPVSHVWRGEGTAIFLEIGELFERTWGQAQKKRTLIQGQFGVMIQWSWRVERPRSVFFGSWSTDRMIDSRLPKLQGQTIVSISAEGRLPELVIQLSKGFWIHSFATAEGQPQWCVFLDRKRSPLMWLVSERGKLIKESPLSP